MLDAVFLFLYKAILAILPWIFLFYLGHWAWRLWVHYVQQNFISGITWLVLEIIPPRDVLRSPKAMELFLSNALYHWSDKGGLEEYWQGAVWFWFSLEIVSIEGRVHFYLRIPSRLQGLVESQMYAQYPQSQIRVVEDYTLAVDEISDRSVWKAWGCEFKLLKPEAYPIKTYVNYGLDKDPKEEYKVDPISPVIEFFSILGKGEQAWVQIVIRPSKKKYKTKGTWLGWHYWVEEAELEMKRLLRPYTSTRQSADDLTHYGIEVRVPKFLDSNIEDMSNKMTKIGFDTGIRVMYVAKKEAFSMNNRRNIRLIFRQYANPDSNQLWRVNSTQGDAYNSIFTSLSPKKVQTLTNRMLQEYRERSFFYLPMRHHLFNEHAFPWPLVMIVKWFFLPFFHPNVFVLNIEELATLWHFPGQILKVPTLERIESKEASPPTNLPT